MITLHQYPESFGLSSLSPFCIKVEFFLKAAKIPYKVQTEFNPKKGPKGKMPFIKDEYENIADSSMVIDHLIKKYQLDHLDIKDPLSRSHARAYQSMVEEHLYFILLYSRWIDPEGFKIIKAHFKNLFPPIVGNIFMEYLRSSLTKQGMAQGIARHSKEEVYQMGTSLLESLSNLLAENKYFFENKLTYFDATIYSFLITIVRQPIDSPLKSYLIKTKNLNEYVENLDLTFRQ